MKHSTYTPSGNNGRTGFSPSSRSGIALALPIDAPFTRETRGARGRTPVLAAGLLFLAFALLCLFLLPPSMARAATVPQVISAMGREMDRQMKSRFGGDDEGQAPAISLSVTTPMDINDLEASNALARQVREELARFFVQAGYQVQEIRKGRDVMFEPYTGEMLLTREERLLGRRSVNSTAIVAGTFTVTPEHVRFNVNIVRTCDREVLAMSTQSVPMNREVAALVGRGTAKGGFSGIPMEPTVVTLLP